MGRQSGFTLIEIVIALGITAIGILSIAQAMQENVSVSAELEKRMIASNIANDALVEYRFDSLTNKIKTGSRNKTVKNSGANWRVNTKVTETDVEKVYLVEVKVRLSSNQEKPYASLISAVADLRQK